MSFFKKVGKLTCPFVIRSLVILWVQFFDELKTRGPYTPGFYKLLFNLKLKSDERNSYFIVDLLDHQREVIFPKCER